MHHSIEIPAPMDATDGLLAELERLDGVITLNVLRGASVKPPGDVITVHALNRAVDAVLAATDTARRNGSVISVSTSELRSILDVESSREIDDDNDEAPWEEMERGLRHHGRLNMNYLGLMGLGGVIAVAGLVSPATPQALALASAGIIAPAFEPAAKLTLGLLRRRAYVIRRALIATVGGYSIMVLSGAVSYLLLQWLGAVDRGSLVSSEAVKTVVDPTAADWVLSGGGAIAGLLIISAFRDTMIPGPLIALALVPATALIGAALAAGEFVMAAEALRRLAVDMMLVIVLGGAIVVGKQHLVHGNRRPMT
jgi:hypothetical protein